MKRTEKLCNFLIGRPDPVNIYDYKRDPGNKPPHPEDELPKISAKEFRDEGYLQEVNRQFLHPLGLALYVREPLNEFGIYDLRDDPEGLYFGEDALDVGKANKVAIEQSIRFAPREDALGYWEQPI